MFCHLHVHNEYSYLDGYGSAAQLISRAKELNFKYLALTNHGNVDGLIKFQKECDKQGISPVLGCELYIVSDMTKKQPKEKRGHITVLVKNTSGWHALCKMLTEANLSGFYYRPRIDFNSLLQADLSGLIILTGCCDSFINLNDGGRILEKIAGKTDVYFEVMPHDSEKQAEQNGQCCILPHLPLVATNDCHYPLRGDWEAQELLLAIQQNKPWADKNRWRFEIKGLHLRSEKEMLSAFKKNTDFHDSELAEMFSNTIKIAKECSKFRIPKQEINLPAISTNDFPCDKLLVAHICRKAIKQLDLSESDLAIYMDRFKTEYDLIVKKKFERYFVVVWDLINSCKKRNIPIGPGRGSVGGSLIAYLMDITAIDPIKYDLLFSRFISDDRIDWPDIDLDFCKYRRPEVVEIIRERYGDHNTCSISTVGRIKAKNAIRDTERIFEIDKNDINQFAKEIYVPSDTHNNDHIKKALDGKFSWFKDKYPKQSHLMTKIEGQARQPGRHAAAVIISADDLTDGKRCVLLNRNKTITCNWDMADSEYCGLIKMDILGLATLSVLEEARRLICARPKKHEIMPVVTINEKNEYEFDFRHIPLDDKNIFKMLSDGDTVGIFQLSGHTSTQICIDMGVESFNDIAIVLAIARPGPKDSGMTEQFIQAKGKHTLDHFHPVLEAVTRETRGILIYQEQIMKALQLIAGFSESQADKIRKVIGKKRDVKEFDLYWRDFKAGAKRIGKLSASEAESFWTMLEHHAKYSFNKAHSTEYAMIAYRTAFMKLYYPDEFICATLSFSDFDEKSNDTSKHKQAIIDYAISQGLIIMTPKVGISHACNWAIKDNILYAPFIEIKGIGETVAKKCGVNRKSKNTGFFNDPTLSFRKADASRAKVLHEIAAYEYGDVLPKLAKIRKYFDFLPAIEESEAPSSANELIEKMQQGDMPENELRFWQKLDMPKSSIPKGLVRHKRHPNIKYAQDDPANCQACDLHDQCRQPVAWSQGKWNAALIGEAPGPQEDLNKRAFFEDAPSGDLLWSIVNSLGYNRNDFHVTNICKCFPSETKTPNLRQIEDCVEQWLWNEMDDIDCRLVLAFGNTAVKTFTDQNSGILKLSGTTTWSDRLEAWVCWCVHPSWVARGNDKQKLIDGIKNFIDKFELLKGD